MSKIVYALGAGASAEVNLPVGSELKHTIASYLSTPHNNIYPKDEYILEALVFDSKNTKEDINVI